MMAGIERLEGLPEVVRDSKLRTIFRNVGENRHIIHTLGKTYRAQQAKEIWVHKENLGSGGQGSVDLQVKVGGAKTPQFRAVKSIRIPEKELESNADFYIRELETIIKFSHARYGDLFVKTYGWFTSKSTLYIAMEYYVLGDLQAYLSDATKCPDNRVPEDQAHDISCQILDALFIMHEERFAHRDIKPANILITSHYPGPWAVKLGDFGISKRDGDVTVATTTVRGTLRFMPPELLGYGPGNSRSVNLYAVDMWCLGETVFRIFAGQATFANQAELFKFHFGQTPFPSHVLKQLDASDELVDFISSLIISEPSERLTAETATQHPWVGEELVTSDHGSAHWSGSEEASVPPGPELRDTFPSASWPTEFLQSGNTQQSSSPAIPRSEQETALAPANANTHDKSNKDSFERNPTPGVFSKLASITDTHTRVELQPQLPDAHTPSSPEKEINAVESETTREPAIVSYRRLVLPVADNFALSAANSLQSHTAFSAKEQSGEQASSSARRNDSPAKTETAKVSPQSGFGERNELLDQIRKMAESLYEKGEYEAAKNTYKNLIDIKTQALAGSKLDKDLLNFKQSLADILYERNDLIGADAQYESVLHGRIALLGESHPDTLRSMQNYATILFERGRYTKAEELYKTIVERRAQSIGSEHPDTLNSMHDLGDTRARLKMMAGAAETYRHVIKLRNKIQDVREIESLRSLADLGADSAQNPIIEVEEMERLVQLKEQTLGAESQDTLNSKLDLADLYEWQDRKLAARELYTQVTEVAEDVFGQHSQFAIQSRLRLEDFQNRWNWDDVHRGPRGRTEPAQAIRPWDSVSRSASEERSRPTPPPKKNVFQRFFR